MESLVLKERIGLESEDLSTNSDSSTYLLTASFGKSLRLSEHQFPHLWRRNKNSALSHKVVKRIKQRNESENTVLKYYIDINYYYIWAEYRRTLVQPLWKTVWNFLRKLKWIYLLTWQFHCWDYILRTLKHPSKRTYAPHNLYY